MMKFNILENPFKDSNLNEQRENDIWKYLYDLDSYLWVSKDRKTLIITLPKSVYNIEIKYVIRWVLDAWVWESWDDTYPCLLREWNKYFGILSIVFDMLNWGVYGLIR